MKNKVGLHLFERVRYLAFKYVYLYEMIKEFLQKTLLSPSPITSFWLLPKIKRPICISFNSVTKKTAKNKRSHVQMVDNKKDYLIQIIDFFIYSNEEI